MQKKEEKKTNTQEKAVSIDTFEMVDRLVQNAQQALKEYMELDQEQVDKIVHAMTLAGLDKHMLLAKMAYEETGRGVMEDKVIKNIFSTEYIWHSIKKQKTVGVIDENEMEGYVEVAEPVGVVAGVTPVTNPTSTTMFKSLICAKTRNPIIFGFHPSAQKCSAQDSVDRDSVAGCDLRFDEPSGRFADFGYRRFRHGQSGVQRRQTCAGRRPRQRALLHQQECGFGAGLHRSDYLQNL